MSPENHKSSHAIVEEDSRTSHDTSHMNGNSDNMADPQAVHAAYLGLERNRKSLEDSYTSLQRDALIQLAQSQTKQQGAMAMEEHPRNAMEAYGGSEGSAHDMEDEEGIVEEQADHNTSHGSGYNDEQFVAEVAAVNRAILELSGKAPSRPIKVEKDDKSYVDHQAQAQQ